MRTWTRHAVDVACGYCTGMIRAGEPVLELGLSRLKRCAACAGEPVPADLPPLPERPIVMPAPSRIVRPTRIGQLDAWHDWKTKQSGDRS